MSHAQQQYLVRVATSDVLKFNIYKCLVLR